MTKIEVINGAFIVILIIFACVNGYIIINNREEYEKKAFLKSVKFSSYSVIYFAFLEIIIGYKSSGFYVPLFYIILLIVAGLGINLIIFQVYLEYDSLEKLFFKNCSYEKKYKLFRFLIKINFVLMLCFITFNIAYSNIHPYSKNVSVGIIGAFSCVFLEFIMLSKLPVNIIIRPKKSFNKLETIFLIGTLIIFFISVISLIIMNRIIL